MLTSEQNSIHEKALLISKNFKKTEIEWIDILQLARQKRIFLALGFGSMFEYANECLGLSPANAYTYTKIAKTAEAIPELKEEIKKGTLSITNARRIVPILNEENKTELIEKASTLTTKALEKVVAEIHPEAVRESVRMVAQNRISLKLGISDAILQKLKRAQALLSNQKRKSASFEEVLEASLDQFLKKQDPLKKAERVMARPERKKDLSARPKPQPITSLVSLGFADLAQHPATELRMYFKGSFKAKTFSGPRINQILDAFYFASCKNANVPFFWKILSQ